MSAAQIPVTMPPIMSAGRYLRLRREAQNLSIGGVACLVAMSPVEASAAAEALRNAEADRELLGDADLKRLVQVIRMVPGIYRALADGRATQAICRVCGCSWCDACTGGCAWVDAAEDLCSSCATGRA